MAWLITAGLAGAQVMTGPNKITKTVSGITFDSAYDNGSLVDMSAGGGANLFNGSLHTDTGEKGTAKYWFRFRMSGVAGRTITLNLDHSETPRPAIRVGAGAWRRMTAAEAPTLTSMVLTFSAQQPEAEVAFFEPLGYEEINEAVDTRVNASAFVSDELIGASHEGRLLRMITVEDTHFPQAGKRRIWVHSRVHAGEVTATHAMLGILDQVLANTEMGRRLREHCIFTVVPVVNADGVARGLTRWDAQGLDEESEWCAIRPPEVAALKTRVDGFMGAANPISVALNLHSTKGNYADSFFFKHLAPSVSSGFVTIQQNYINAVNNASPLFNNASPQTSQLNACTFIESYFYNNWGSSVMALTHEGHYYKRQTDGDWITGADYRAIGGALVSGLTTYYPLPASSEPALTYATWAALHFTAGEIATPGTAGPNDDPDKDGSSNLLEYALGRAPGVSDAGVAPLLLLPPGPSEPATAWQVTASHSILPADLEVYFERSTDLITWSRTPDPAGDVGGYSQSVFSGRRPADGHPAEWLTLHVPPAGAGTKQYFRLAARRLP